MYKNNYIFPRLYIYKKNHVINIFYNFLILIYKLYKIFIGISRYFITLFVVKINFISRNLYFLYQKLYFQNFKFRKIFEKKLIVRWMLTWWLLPKNVKIHILFNFFIDNYHKKCIFRKKVFVYVFLLQKKSKELTTARKKTKNLSFVLVSNYQGYLKHI